MHKYNTKQFFSTDVDFLYSKDKNGYEEVIYPT